MRAAAPTIIRRRADGRYPEIATEGTVRFHPCRFETPCGIQRHLATRGIVTIFSSRGRQTAPSTRLLDEVLSPFFSTGELATLRGYLTMEDVEEGTVIAKQNDASDAMFFVEYGKVSFYLNVDRHTRKRLRTYVSGTIVGEMGFYTNAPRSADIIAEESTRLYRMGREDSQRMEQENPALAIKLHRYVIRLVSSRLQAANDGIESLL